MKIGIRVPSPELGVEIDPAFVACTAEEMGFESIWYPEHTVLPVSTQARYTWSAGTDGDKIPAAYSAFVDPFIALARASAVTTKLKLATGVTLIPERNPLLLAKEVATLDRFSEGRLLLGIGAGWIAEQSSIMGGDFPRRWRQTREAVQVMKALWTQDEAEFHGEYYDFPPVRCNPKPCQRPHPPILIGGESKHAFRRVVEWGDGWVPADVAPPVVEQGRMELERLADQAGRDPSTLEVTAHYVEPRREAVKAMFDAGADRVVVRRLVTVNSEEEMARDLERIAENVL